MTYVSQSPATVRISSPSYPGAQFDVPLNGDKPKTSGGIAKYTQVARPTLRDALEFDSEDPLKLSFGVLFDAWPDGSVEDLLGRLYGLAARAGLPEPPIVNVFGPLPYTQLDYKITSLTLGDAAEYRADGQRCRQDVKLELTEFVAVSVVAVNVSPVAAAVAASPSTTSAAPTATGTYTVKRGDTLYGIAQKSLGNGNRWPEIAKKNNIRDPKRIQPGQVLQLP